MLTSVGTNNEANREEWLEEALRKIPAGSKILDAGAGELQYKRFCSHLDYVSQDFAQYDGAGDNLGLQMGSWDQSKLDIVCDITAIPEPDASFDAIMCIEVFEHLPNPILVLQEFSRLLRPGGHLILTAPFCSLTHFAPFHFYSGFNRYFYETHLPASGLDIVELRHNGNFIEYVAQEIRRIGFISKKYAGIKLNLLEKIVIQLMLFVLARLVGRDTGSHELLCFGYHVSAVKKG
ncbi:MAG: methyltransferase domain-containing protein [Geobacteraceae bacterium]|nr:methyltransferase domain-containing protein [Geobacteraceae bacterium]NTW80258.1 methyltransferase domain-containing protein [Geobacteraceae bacterium]